MKGFSKINSDALLNKCKVIDLDERIKNRNWLGQNIVSPQFVIMVVGHGNFNRKFQWGFVSFRTK